MRAFFVVNRRAGQGTVARRWPEASSNPVVTAWKNPDSRGHATVLAREAAAAGYDAVVAVGGDGTLNEVVNGLMSCPAASRPALGCIPAGTANDFARSCGVPLEWDAAMAAVANGRRRRIDIGQATGEWGDRYWSIGAFIGAPAVIAEAANKTGKSRGGFVGYLPHLAGALRHRTLVTVEADGETTEEVVLALEVGNGSSGCSVQVNPGAIPDDGWLDLLVVRARSVPATLNLLAAAMRGRHVHHRGVVHTQVRCVRLTGDGVALSLDGEMAGFLPVTLEIVPAALDLIVPAV